ncbi:hypothetical protein F4774DRAFT_47468 [Daldinia eschscholtzii]|nr:hypothetical protein F4774DRAFT_47468 [Daldinia eschscholtzii]
MRWKRVLLYISESISCTLALYYPSCLLKGGVGLVLGYHSINDDSLVGPTKSDLIKRNTTGECQSCKIGRQGFQWIVGTYI